MKELIYGETVFFWFFIEFLVESEPLLRKSAIVFSKAFNISSNTRSFAMLFAGFKFAILKNLFLGNPAAAAGQTKQQLAGFSNRVAAAAFAVIRIPQKKKKEIFERTSLQKMSPSKENC